MRKLFDKIRPKVARGARWGFLHSTFEAFESLLYVPKTVTTQGCHVRDAVDLKRTMTVVVAALMPALLFGMWNVGYQHFLALSREESFWTLLFYGFSKVFPMLVVSYAVGLGIEFAVAQLRGHEVNEGFLVTGLLIPLLMPPDLPLWMLALATAFAVLIGKEAFGGTGMNIFNPALLARAFVFFAYPSRMSGDSIWVSGLAGGESVVDGFSGATPLVQAAGGQLAMSGMELQRIFWGLTPGSIGETCTPAILLGAALLLFTGIGSWRVMLSVTTGGLLVAALFNHLGANPYMSLPPYYHLLMGGFAFGAVFMATDPVTGSQTRAGQWLYGFMIGALAITIRVLNPAYPEGMMLAILFMNAFAPLIDYCVVQANIRKRTKRSKR
jgi:Na+-transporting NADH:ubiquinone oxidoreductase subunit B